MDQRSNGQTVKRSNDSPLFTILPAIDLQHGHCVRLRQGVATDSTDYGSDPVAQARDWQTQGAPWLHLVDLDGAFAGRPAHLPVLRAICDALSIPVETGGGLRTDADIDSVLSAGASRAILGTRALENPDTLPALVARFGEKIAVGIDARNGLVQTKGWTHTSTVPATDLAARCSAAGVATLIYTDTATDGMLTGPNLPALAAICDAAPRCSVIASGGVSSPGDILAIRRLSRPNLVGAIVGKALYERRTTLPSLLSSASSPL